MDQFQLCTLQYNFMSGNSYPTVKDTKKMITSDEHVIYLFEI